MRLHCASLGKRVSRRQILLGPDSEWVIHRVDDTRVFFWRRSPGGAAAPPFTPSGPIHIVGLYPAEDLARMPPAPVDAAAWTGGAVGL